MHPAFAQTAHRPWPLPRGPWLGRQSWLDLLFAHWPVPAAMVRSLVPPALEIDEYDGTTWIGLVPFRMAGVMLRGLPDMPGISDFPELNVRLYVRHGGKPGVWFLSLDAANALAVWAARRFFHLPYHRAWMSLRQRDEEIEYRSERRAGGARFRARYRPSGAVYSAWPGTLEHWLTERYCLYAASPGGTLLRTEVHHVPWPLQRAEAHIDENGMFEPHGVRVAGRPALLHFAHAIHVVVWPQRACGGATP